MKILLAYDGFEYSRHALEEAAKMATREDSTVTVVSVIPPSARGSKSGGHMGLPPHAEEDVTKAHDFFGERGLEAETKVRVGDPAEELIAEATEGRYDIAVAGSRGLGPVGQLLHGSVSRKLVKQMPCPVMVAGAEKTERYEPEALAQWPRRLHPSAGRVGWRLAEDVRGARIQVGGANVPARVRREVDSDHRPERCPISSDAAAIASIGSGLRPSAQAPTNRLNSSSALGLTASRPPFEASSVR